MRPRKVLCGTKGAVGSPRSVRRRLAVSGGPCRTAKTPALGRGCSSTAATSPEAKTSGVLVDSSDGWTAMKPSLSRASDVCRSHSCAPPCVHQIASSYGISRPSSVTSADGVACSTDVPRTTTTFRSLTRRSKMARTPLECCGRRMGERETSVTSRHALGSRPSLRSSADSRWCIERVSSTPPAPAPTTTRRAVEPAGMWRTRSRMASHRLQKPSIGLTGVIAVAARGGASSPPPPPPPPAPRIGTGLGAEPMSIESTS